MARNELWLTVLAVSSVGIIKDKSLCNKVIRPTTNTVKTHDMRWLKRALLVSIENTTQDGSGHRQGEGALASADYDSLRIYL